MEYARVVMHNGSPAIEVDGEIFPPMTVTLLRHDEAYYADLRKAGIRIFFLTCATEWLREDALPLLQRNAEKLLKAVPDALCFLRISLDPPVSWMEAHPEERMLYSDGSFEPFTYYTEFIAEQIPGQYFLGSKAWREECAAHLISFLDALDKTPLSDHIIGYFLAAGVCSEWNSGNPLNMWQKDKGAGFSPTFRREFGDYLREKYGTQERLREAWRDPEATFEDPHIPPMDERFFTKMDDLVMNQYEEFAAGEKNPGNGTTVGSFLDMDRYACVMDFMRASHYGSANSIVYFAELLKQRDDRKMVGAFYGGYGCTDYFNCGSAGCVLKILDSRVDYLATPGLYDDRQPGGVTAQREMQDSFRLRGKFFISEDDTRTHCDGDYYRETMHLYTLEDSANVLKRDFGRNICEDIYGWWFDHSATGTRYMDTGIYELFARQQEIARFAYSLDRRKHNEVALIFDEESISLVTQQTSYELCDLFRTSEVHRLGMPVDYYFHNDLAREDMPDYKVYIFVNCFYLSDEERRAIQQKVRRKGKMAIWIYASGYINPDAENRMDAKNITALTGIRTRMEPGCAFTNFRITTDHPSMSTADPYRIYGKFDRNIQSNVWLRHTRNVTYAYPLFTTEDPNAQVLGRFCNTDLPALTLKEENGFLSVFCGAKILRADLIQSLARYAGCHIWSDNTDDILYANDHFVVLHAASTGEKTLRLPRKATVFEVYEKRFYGSQTQEITFPMHFGETKMFSLDGSC